MWRWLDSWPTAAVSALAFSALGVHELVDPSDGTPAWLWLAIGAIGWVKTVVAFRDERRLRKPKR